ncbi:MAG: hypothetical protein KIG14_00920 [Candidatus Sacchiramonaceae bacterium]|nr:hypothetical protein [Candidatus Saccharimonadaceae bacterium]
MSTETPNFNSTSILNKLYSAEVVDNEFTTDDGQKRTYSSLELAIKINGQQRKLAITLPTRSNVAVVLLAAEDKPSNLFDEGEENM